MKISYTVISAVHEVSSVFQLHTTEQFIVNIYLYNLYDIECEIITDTQVFGLISPLCVCFCLFCCACGRLKMKVTTYILNLNHKIHTIFVHIKKKKIP